MEKKVSFDISPEEMAEVFAHMDDDQQARFFSKAEEVFQTFDYDMQTMGISENLDKAGTDFVYRLANWRKVRGIASCTPKWDSLMATYPEEN